MASRSSSSSSSSSSIYFASVPDFRDLCSVVLQVENNPSLSASEDMAHIKYVGCKPQIVKCRELLFTDPDLIASPSLQQEGHIYVVLEQSVWKSGRLQARCQKMGLQMNQPMRVISAVFQACLAYTIRARLAPLWNKAGNWYLLGRDFLTAPGKVAAMDMELNVTENEICLSLRPLIARLPRCSIGDFDVCQPVLEQFFLSRKSVISEYSIDSKWCYILPSLKKGKVVSISHEIPATSPFKTYKDIRRYWKNAYGYRLPDELTAGMLYYNIYFPAIGPTLFTYPELCIRKEEPVLQGRVDAAPILRAFLADLQHKMPSVCGTAFEVKPRAQYATTGLYPTGKEEANLSQLNLSSTPPPTSVRRIPTRPFTVQGFPYSTPPTTLSVAQTRMTPTGPLSGTVGDINPAFAFAGHGPTPQRSVSSATPQAGGGQFGLQRGYSRQAPGSVFDSLSSVSPRPVLENTCFRPALPEQRPNSHHVDNHGHACNSNAPYYNQCVSTVTMLNDGQLHMRSSVVTAQPRIVPRFVAHRPQTSHPSPAAADATRVAQSTTITPKFLHAKKSTYLHLKSQAIPPASVLGNACLRHASHSNEVQFTQGTGPHIAESASRTETKTTFAPSFPCKDSGQAARGPSKSRKTQQTLDALIRKTPSSCQQPQADCKAKTTKRKPKSTSEEGLTGIKKARTKPKVQDGIDVQSLAINDQLSKVNTITLLTWLKNKGIPVRAKDKKADLMNKVAQYIHTNSTED